EMPKLAAFPKAFMQALCKDGTMTVSEWIRLAAPLDVDGLEWYAGFIGMEDERNWSRYRREAEAHGKVIPMLCCSPDFKHPDKKLREAQVTRHKQGIRMAAARGGADSRVLSGHRGEGLSLKAGLQYAPGCSGAGIPLAPDAAA